MKQFTSFVILILASLILLNSCNNNETTIPKPNSDTIKLRKLSDTIPDITPSFIKKKYGDSIYNSLIQYNIERDDLGRIAKIELEEDTSSFNKKYFNVSNRKLHNKSNAFTFSVHEFYIFLQKELGIIDFKEPDKDLFNYVRIYPAINTEIPGEKHLYFVLMGEKRDVNTNKRVTMLDTNIYKIGDNDNFQTVLQGSPDYKGILNDIKTFQEFWMKEEGVEIDEVKRSMAYSIFGYYAMMIKIDPEMINDVYTGKNKYKISIFPGLHQKGIKLFAIGMKDTKYFDDIDKIYNNMDVCPRICPLYEIKYQP